MRSDSSYVHFDIEDDVVAKIELSKELVQYVNKKFVKFIPDKVIQENILDTFPIPSNLPVKAPRINDYVGEIFSSSGKSYRKSYDSNFAQIQSRMGSILGPLSKLWSEPDTVEKSGNDEDLDLFAMLDLVEKTITLVGQAFVVSTYHRRMNILYNLTKDVKKAKRLIHCNEDNLERSWADNKLFCKKFYKALLKAATIRKSS